MSSHLTLDKERVSAITQPFKNLDDHKQQRILNAALEEFAEKGYEQASTNRMVKNAGIGKGMLFYYFKSKKELYLYLINYGIRIIIDEFISRIDATEADFIERLRQITRIKMEYMYANPHVSMFLATVTLTDELTLPPDLQTRLENLRITGNSMLYDNIDSSLFRPDVDRDKAFQLIRWSVEGYQNELMNQLKGQHMTLHDMEPYWEEFYEYLDVLKTVFYEKK